MGWNDYLSPLPQSLLVEVAFGDLTLNQRLVAVTLIGIILPNHLACRATTWFLSKRPQPYLLSCSCNLHDVATTGEERIHLKANFERVRPHE